MRTTRLLLLLGFSLLIGSPAMAGAESALDWSQILRELGFDEKRVRTLGETSLINELEVPDRSRQVAFAGLARVRGDGKALVESIAKGAAPPLTTPDRFGYFGNPAEKGDLDRLRLDDDDYEVLAECKPAACRFKLSEQGIAQAQATDWRAPNAPREFLDQFRDALAKLTARYQDQGMAGLITYDDKPKPFPAARGAVQLAAEMSLLPTLNPALASYLNSYPAKRPAGVTGRLLWSVSDFGYRPTLSVDHVLIQRSNQLTGAPLTIVMRTIYSNHYLAGRLQVGSVIDGQAAFGVPGHLLLVVDRMLFDDKLSSIKRSLLSHSLKSNVSDRMIHIQTLAAGGD